MFIFCPRLISFACVWTLWSRGHISSLKSSPLHFIRRTSKCIQITSPLLGEIIIWTADRIKQTVFISLLFIELKKVCVFVDGNNAIASSMSQCNAAERALDTVPRMDTIATHFRLEKYTNKGSRSLSTVQNAQSDINCKDALRPL